MRKLYLLLLLLSCLLPYTAIGQESKVIGLTYNAADFRLEEEHGLTYITSPVYTYSFLADTLSPALPYMGVYVLIGADSQYESFSYSSTEQFLSGNIEMAPNPIDIPSDVPLPLEGPGKTNFHDANYPEEAVIYTGTHIMDGYHFLSFLVCPFRYDAGSRDLYLKSNFTLTVSLKNNARNSLGFVGHNMRSTVLGMVINSGDMDALYPHPTRTSYTGYKYLIVTSNALKPAFQRLADWKTQKGVRAKVLTTEEIYSAYPDSSHQMSIKKALKDYYNGTYSDLEYALLGGDLPVVPSQECYVRYSTSQTYTPADLYYTSFDTMNWDTNGNGVYGEKEDSVELTPEIIVSRLPVTNMSQANAIVDRILTYERNPNLETLYDNILMSGNKTNCNVVVNDTLISDAHMHGNMIWNDSIAPYWYGNRKRFYDTGTDFTGGANYTLNASNLQNELQKGYPLLYMETHGHANGWKLEQGEYNNTIANSLVNSGNTTILTSACFTNAIDSACLSKSLMNNADSGILAYFGSSREGWLGGTSYGIGYSNRVLSSLLKKLFTNGNGCLMEAEKETICSLIGYLNNYSLCRWIIFTLNPLCDPEMPVYLSVPQKFNEVQLSMTGSTLNVNATFSGCKMAVMSMTDIPYYEVRENVETASFTSLPEKFSLCITKAGYVPYTIEFSGMKFIQNQTLSGDNRFAANSIKVGSNVLPSSYGPVTVESGKTTLYGNDVDIKNGFGVKLGAQFEINTYPY